MVAAAQAAARMNPTASRLDAGPPEQETSNLQRALPGVSDSSAKWTLNGLSDRVTVHICIPKVNPEINVWRHKTTSIGIDIKHETRLEGLAAMNFVRCAVLAEEAGFESVWTNEDIGYDSLALLSALSQHTKRVSLGTAIVNCFTRTAMQLAMGIATVDELSGGRAITGISLGHHPWTDKGHGLPIEAPLPRLREYIAVMRKVLSGRPFTHDGRFFSGVETQLNFPPVRDHVPIHVAGERPQMIKLAAEMGDGLMLNIVGADYIANFAAEHFRASARAAGRNPDELELTALVTCCIANDRDEALNDARRMLIYRLRRGPRVKDVLAPVHHDEVDYLWQLIQAGRRELAIEEASESLVSAIMNAGTTDQVVEGIQKYFDAGCTRVVVVAYPRGQDAVRRLIRAIGPNIA